VNRGKTFNSHTAETCKGRLKAEAKDTRPVKTDSRPVKTDTRPVKAESRPRQTQDLKRGTGAETLQEGCGEEGEAGKV
jgi:hypothetical protein